jgi:hypothetical protein
VYYDAILNAEILSIHTGFVKMMGSIDEYTHSSLYQSDSDIHARRHDGIEVKDLGYVSNSGMKMVYTVSNAKVVAELIEQHFEEITRFEQIVRDITSLLLQKIPVFWVRHLPVFLNVTYRERILSLLRRSYVYLYECPANIYLRDEIIDILRKKLLVCDAVQNRN